MLSATEIERAFCLAVQLLTRQAARRASITARAHRSHPPHGQSTLLSSSGARHFSQVSTRNALAVVEKTNSPAPPPAGASPNSAQQSKNINRDPVGSFQKRTKAKKVAASEPLSTQPTSSSTTRRKPRSTGSKAKSSAKRGKQVKTPFGISSQPKAPTQGSAVKTPAQIEATTKQAMPVPTADLTIPVPAWSKRRSLTAAKSTSSPEPTPALSSDSALGRRTPKKSVMQATKLAVTSSRRMSEADLAAGRARARARRLEKKEEWEDEKLRRDRLEARANSEGERIPVFEYPPDRDFDTERARGSSLPLGAHFHLAAPASFANRDGEVDVATAEDPGAVSEVLEKEALEEVSKSAPPPPEDDDEKGQRKSKAIVGDELDEIMRDTPPTQFENWETILQGTRKTLAAEGSLSANDVVLQATKPDRHMVVARLRANLTGVPFSPGVHFLQDPRTGVYNFDPEQLQDIPRPEEFAYDRVAPYSKPSTHAELGQLAEQTRCSYAGSTSTLTKAFSHIYFLLSRGKPIDITSLSGPYTHERTDFTFGAQLPACLEVTRGENGVWYVDSDKSWDLDNNVLSEYGVIMEKMLTLSPKDFSKLLKKNKGEKQAQKADMDTEAFYYQHGHKLMMRSQLDCYDPRLPGTGVFDIKTRACWPIRYDRANWEVNSQYVIHQDKGFSQSFEREYYDMLRATMLKYSMQARIGAMDGIFVAYHSTSKVFGFQYLPLSMIDEHLFGSTEMAEKAFRLCVALFENIMDSATSLFPNEDQLSLIIKHIPGELNESGMVATFVQPKAKGRERPPVRGLYLTSENFVDGEKVDGPVELDPELHKRLKQDWSIQWKLSESSPDFMTQSRVQRSMNLALTAQQAMFGLACPEGKTIKQMEAMDNANLGPVKEGDDTPRTRWMQPNSKQLMLRKEAKESAADHRERMKGWQEGHDQVLSWQPVPTPKEEK